MRLPGRFDPIACHEELAEDHGPASSEGARSGTRRRFSSFGPAAQADLISVRRMRNRPARHAYRIVQEALTNARRHAPGMPVTLTVAAESAPGESGADGSASIGARPGEAGGGVRIEVRNPLPAAPKGAPPSGMGLVGLAERAELSGGRLDYGRENGHFHLTAWLPWTP